MSDFAIISIIVGAFVFLVIFLATVKKLTMPKFPEIDYETYKNIKHRETIQNKTDYEPKLSFSDKYIDENSENELEEKTDERPEKINFPRFRPNIEPKKKTLLQQINELSPEMKMILLDKGLALKDFDLKSKKN